MPIFAKKGGTYSAVANIFVKQAGVYTAVKDVFVKEAWNYIPIANNDPSILQVLAKYGNAAHMWIPGVGVINGVTASNWANAAGTIPASVGSVVANVRDVQGGLTVTQSTVGSAPTLRGSKSRWEFDGVNDHLLLPYNTFKMADDFCIVAGASLLDATTSRSIYAQSNYSNHTLPDFGFNTSGQLGLNVAAGAVTASAYGGSSNVGAGAITASVRNLGGSVIVQSNGTQVAATTLPVVSSLPLTAAIGAWPALTVANFFKGDIYPVIVIKGTVSDADYTVVKNYVNAWLA